MRYYWLRFFCLACIILTLPVTDSSAAEKCKVKVDKKDGTILFSATGVGGTLTWGEESGSETNPFSNDLACIAGGLAKKCRLGETAETGRITPPALCTLYVADSGGNDCSAYIKGCTPGVRSVPGSPAAQSVLSARIALDATVSNESADWIDGDCTRPVTGTYTCTINGGVFTQSPNCTAVATSITATAHFAWTGSATSVEFRTADTSGVATNASFTVLCEDVP